MSKIIMKNIKFFSTILFISSLLFFLYHLFLIGNSIVRCYINDDYSTIFNIFSFYMLFNFIFLFIIGYIVEWLNKIDLDTFDLKHELWVAYRIITNQP